ILLDTDVSNIGLHHTNGATPQALNVSRQEQEPDASRESEDDVGDSGNKKTGENGRSSSVTVGEPAPRGRADKLSYGKCSDESAHHCRVCAKARRVERKERIDNYEDQHVHERRDHEYSQLASQIQPLARFMNLPTEWNANCAECM